MKVKTGTLRKNTFIYTSGPVLRVRKGTKVVVEGGVLRFNPAEGVWVSRVGKRYYLHMFGAVFRIEFPRGGRAPYPLSML